MSVCVYVFLCGSFSSAVLCTLPPSPTPDPQENWPSDADTVARVEALMQPGIGDRRQELVFIGQDLKVSHTKGALGSSRWLLVALGSRGLVYT